MIYRNEQRSEILFKSEYVGKLSSKKKSLIIVGIHRHINRQINNKTHLTNPFLYKILLVDIFRICF